MTQMIRTHRNRSGLSLIEILVVLAIVGILAAILIPAMSGNRAADLSKSAADLSGILELAQAHAKAHNSSVEVGLRSDADGLAVVTIAGRDGSPLRQLGKIHRFPGVRLAAISTEPERPDADVEITTPPTDAIAGFDFRNESYPYVIQFDSRGTARVRSDQLSKIIEIGLLPNIDGETPTALEANSAVIQIAGLSGTTIVYRP